MKTKILYTTTILMLVFFIFIFSYLDDLKKEYIKLFKRNAIVAHYNSNGQLNGEFASFLNGKIYMEGNFVNGVREGWVTEYFEDAHETPHIKHKQFYSYGKANGRESEYYENGKLNYTVKWSDDKRFGSEYHYSIDGKPINYDAFDKSGKLGMYCYVAYDKAGNFHQILGHVFSSFIYSKCKDSIIALHDKTQYRCLKDLYIDVALPPQFTTEMNISINDIDIKHHVIENTVILPNVFVTKGNYHIVIRAKLNNRNGGGTIKSDSLKTTILNF